MQAADQDAANIQVGRAMLQGDSWREAVQAAGVQMSRATAYRLRQRVLVSGAESWYDGRQGHPSKVCGAVRTWLEDYYQHHPRAPGKVVQALLEEQSGVRVSVTHLNRVRAALTGTVRRGEKSARSVAGRGRWSPPVGRNPGNQPPSNVGGGPSHPGGCATAAPTGMGHRQDATILAS